MRIDLRLLRNYIKGAGGSGHLARATARSAVEEPMEPMRNGVWPDSSSAGGCVSSPQGYQEEGIKLLTSLFSASRFDSVDCIYKFQMPKKTCTPRPRAWLYTGQVLLHGPARGSGQRQVFSERLTGVQDYLGW